MALLYPLPETIGRLKQPATEAELTLLRFLFKNLDNTYEIFYKSYVNGDNPDIVLMKKGYGVVIIGVNDWALSDFNTSKPRDWKKTFSGGSIVSPLQQVEKYRDNFIQLHIESFLEKVLLDKSYFALVNCMVYFHIANESEIHKKLLEPFRGKPEYASYLNQVKFNVLWGKDSLSANGLRLLSHKFSQHNPLFTDELYEEFRRCLQPPLHTIEEGRDITYSKEQRLLIVSEANRKRKIKGMAGSGKTLVLARLAVNAQKRCNSRVLILTYNLSLKNYIRDRIYDIREEFEWKSFCITNYHQFFKSQANNVFLKIKGLDAWQDERFFKGAERETERFGAILIDEVQDYKREWLVILTEYFLAPDGEFVVFGDEKQNIYQRPLDEEKESVIPGIFGRWNKSLKTSYRLNSKIAGLSTHFQKRFFDQKYSVEEITALNAPELGFEQPQIKYFYLQHNQTNEQVFEIINEQIRIHQVHNSDVAILNSKVDYIRTLDKILRKISRIQTKTTFETQEFYEKLKQLGEVLYADRSSEIKKALLNEKLEEIRRNKKNHLTMKTGTPKLSTIHSFKGWEIPTLFLIIEGADNDQEAVSAELIYTGITRARNNLFVINLNNQKYDSFFREHIKDQFSY